MVAWAGEAQRAQWQQTLLLVIVPPVLVVVVVGALAMQPGAPPCPIASSVVLAALFHSQAGPRLWLLALACC